MAPGYQGPPLPSLLQTPPHPNHPTRNIRPLGAPYPRFFDQTPPDPRADGPGARSLGWDSPVSGPCGRCSPTPAAAAGLPAAAWARAQPVQPNRWAPRGHGQDLAFCLAEWVMVPLGKSPMFKTLILLFVSWFPSKIILVICLSALKDHHGYLQHPQADHRARAHPKQLCVFGPWHLPTLWALEKKNKHRGKKNRRWRANPLETGRTQTTPCMLIAFFHLEQNCDKLFCLICFGMGNKSDE